MLRSLLRYGAQIAVVAFVGYVIWYWAYGKPNVPLGAWLVICLFAALIGLIPYAIGAFLRRRAKDGR